MLKKLKLRLDRLSLQKRLFWSNLLMFMIPVTVTALTALSAFGLAFYAFQRFYLPRAGLTLADVHDMGEQFESALQSFWVFLAALVLVTLALLMLSIFITNRFLVRFMLARVEEPLNRLTEGVAHVRAGDLDHVIAYDRPDEFKPVCDAFNDMAARLKTSAEQAAAEEKIRMELFADISHDLRSPLTSVRAYTEALLDGVSQSPTDTQRYLNKIRLHEAELERLVDALFLYTKMELKDYPVHLEALNIQEALLRMAAGNTFSAHLSVNIAAVPGLSVLADPFLWERMVWNLLDNSRKYRRNDVAHVRICAAQTAEGVLLSFHDDGIGVPAEQFDHLFAPFYRTDPARSRTSSGSGLGLAIVRSAVIHMGGQIWAEASPDGGLCIHVQMQEAKRHGGHFDS